MAARHVKVIRNAVLIEGVLRIKSIFICFIISIILISGCAGKVEPNSNNELLIKPEVQTESQNNITETVKQTGSADLDGNGIEDKIVLECQPERYDFTLTVNGVSVSGQGDNLDGYFAIIDIDVTDKFKEIAISESGPSSDEKTAFYYYDGEEIKLVGKVEGSNNSIKILGDGKVIANTRGQILQTWFYEDIYRLSKSHSLERVPQDLYKMNSKVKMQKQLELYESRTSTKVSVVLKKGEEVIILSSDDKKWCLVESSKGEKGWFAVEDFNYICGTTWNASEVFEGLCYAD